MNNNVQNIKESILVVDDDHAALELLKAMVHKWFPEVLMDLTDTKKGAYALAVEKEYSLILVDWTIETEGDGAELISMLRSQNINTPTIIMSGLPEAVERVMDGKYEVYDKGNGGLEKLMGSLRDFLSLNNLNRRLTSLTNLVADTLNFEVPDAEHQRINKQLSSVH